MFAFSETNKIILNCALQKKVIKKLKMKSGHGLVWGLYRFHYSGTRQFLMSIFSLKEDQHISLRPMLTRNLTCRG